MKFQKPARKTVVKYVAIATLSTAGFLLYTNDRVAPVVSEFSFAESDAEPGRYKFSGRITDERGVSKAFFRCLEGEQEQLVLDVAMSGSNRNQVSFGLISKSPHWAGNWKGTSYDLRFQGQTLLTELAPTCQWQAELEDSLGNKTVQLLK